MVFIFFIYGLSFFVLGIIISVYPRTNSQLKLADNLWLLALFGIFHGVNEWLDMFMFITPEYETILGGIRMAVLPISFYFLVQFGMNSIIKIRNRHPALKWLPSCLLLLWTIIVALSGKKFLSGDIGARYLLCVPGTLLAAYALILNLPDCNRLDKPEHLNHLMKMALASFLLYGICSGVIVPEAGFFPASIINYRTFFGTLGLPIQLFRAICAVLMAYSVTGILSVFEWETIDSLRKAHEELEERVSMRTASLQALNSDLREALEKAKKT